MDSTPVLPPQEEPESSGVSLRRRTLPGPAQVLSHRLAAQWRIVQKKFPSDGQSLDPDTVHDLRVASRRVRAVLSLAREISPGKKIRRPIKDMRRLGRALGSVREADVNIEQLLKRRKRWVGQEVAAAESLLALDFERQRRLRAKMERRLRAIDLGRLERDLESLKLAAREPLPVSLPEFARSKVDERMSGLRTVLERARLHPTPRSFHLLRIEVKKFRYAVEILSLAFDSRRGTAIRSRLKSLQDDLGEFHDLAVLHRSLGVSRRNFGREELEVLSRQTLGLQRRLAGELKESARRLSHRLNALSRTGFWEHIPEALRSEPAPDFTST
jgi:CHAD domain-containing protein